MRKQELRLRGFQNAAGLWWQPAVEPRNYFVSCFIKYLSWFARSMREKRSSCVSLKDQPRSSNIAEVLCANLENHFRINLLSVASLRFPF